MRGKRLSGASAGVAAAVVAGDGVAAGAAARIRAPGAVLKKAGAKGKPTRPRLARRKNSRRGESGEASVDESVRERGGESAMGRKMRGWRWRKAGKRTAQESACEANASLPDRLRGSILLRPSRSEMGGNWVQKYWERDMGKGKREKGVGDGCGMVGVCDGGLRRRQARNGQFETKRSTSAGAFPLAHPACLRLQPADPSGDLTSDEP